jgi:hypothetical protein
MQMNTQATERLTSGQFSIVDSTGRTIILEWERIDPKTAQLTEKIKLLSPLLIKAYLEIELEFAKKKPETIATDMFLKPLEPLLVNGLDKVDWNIAALQISKTLTHFFTDTDWSNYAKSSDSHFFIVAKDNKLGTQLGMIQFIISPEYAKGNVKVELYDGVCQKESMPDLQKILLSAIFKLIPTLNRIFFHTRITNLKGIKIHETLGFSKFVGNLPNWIDLEYKVERSEILQEFSLTFVD